MCWTKSDKGTTPEQAFNAVRSAREAGIKTVGHFILGLPGETRESLEVPLNMPENCS